MEFPSPDAPPVTTATRSKLDPLIVGRTAKCYTTVQHPLGADVSDNELSYDTYDIEIDADPYPVCKRLRNEAPLYYNERPDVWGLSRFEDVEAALKDSMPAMVG